MTKKLRTADGFNKVIKGTNFYKVNVREELKNIYLSSQDIRQHINAELTSLHESIIYKECAQKTMGDYYQKIKFMPKVKIETEIAVKKEKKLREVV